MSGVEPLSAYVRRVAGDRGEVEFIAREVERLETRLTLGWKAAERQRRATISQKRKAKGIRQAYERACDLIDRALDEDQDGYRLAPDLEVRMRGELFHRASRKLAEQDMKSAPTSDRDVAEKPPTA